jgi:anti-anti-sigma regulatory factor
VDVADESPSPSPGALGSPTTIVVVLEASITPHDVHDLGLRLARSGATTLTCDASGLTEPNVTTVDVLARLQLTLHQRGRSMHLRHAPGELRDLLAWVGLNDVLPVTPSALEPVRKVEDGEQSSVNEMGEPGDTPA